MRSLSAWRERALNINDEADGLKEFFMPQKSVKGTFRLKAGGFVFLKEFYTGLRYKVEESKAYLCKGADGLMVLCDRRHAVLC